ncbi:hypothetical protein MRX96_050932 [Rhipicephalus microplus]
MPSAETRIAALFPPLADEVSDAEKHKLEHLKHHCETMHSAFENGEFESIDAFLDKFGVKSDADYADVLWTEAARPYVLHRGTPAKSSSVPSIRGSAPRRLQHESASNPRPLGGRTGRG